MSYSKHYLTWENIKLEISYDPMWLKSANDPEEQMAHLEVRVLEPAKAALPITDTGYRSHFTPSCNVLEYGNPASFVKAWLDHEAKSREWKEAREKAQQLNLF